MYNRVVVHGVQITYLSSRLVNRLDLKEMISLRVSVTVLTRSTLTKLHAYATQLALLTIDYNVQLRLE